MEESMAAGGVELKECTYQAGNIIITVISTNDTTSQLNPGQPEKKKTKKKQQS